MQRRTFLKSAAMLPVLAYFPRSLSAQTNNQKVLILVQFGGGNDSLNTFVPFTDSAYYAARGNLAIASEEVIPLSDSLGLNPVMSSLQDAWEHSDLAVVQGLGYPNPNRSHFRGIDIWHTASSAEEVLQSGWLTKVLPEHNSPLQGVVVSGSPGALRGEENQFSTGSDPTSLTQVYSPTGTPVNSTAEFIQSQRNTYNTAVAELNQAFATPINLATEFASDSFSAQCEIVAHMLAAGVRPHVLHVSLGSFDTHSNQRAQHDTLLNQLADGLASLRAELIHQGLWPEVTIASYSEFGRRVAVNGSGGTDHGTAASHLVMGGSVKGGVYGQMPSLTDLDNGDLKFTADFRAYYRTLNDWMNWQGSEQLSEHSNMGFI